MLIMVATIKAMLLAMTMLTHVSLRIAIVMVDMAMVGRLGTKELAASALANTFFNCLQHPVSKAKRPRAENRPNQQLRQQRGSTDHHITPIRLPVSHGNHRNHPVPVEAWVLRVRC